MPFLLAENCHKGPKLTKISHFDHLIVNNNDRFASNVAIFDENVVFSFQIYLKLIFQNQNDQLRQSVKCIESI